MSRISTVTEFNYPNDDLVEVPTTSRTVDVVYYPSLIDYWREVDPIAINHARVDSYEFPANISMIGDVYAQLNLTLGGDNEVKTIS